ncbi:hypothetical protein AB4K20DRAFT_1884295 [Rhizopus microsporus]
MISFAVLLFLFNIIFNRQFKVILCTNIYDIYFINMLAMTTVTIMTSRYPFLYVTASYCFCIGVLFKKINFFFPFTCVLLFVRLDECIEIK